ncbi:MAG: hypothetical protein ACP6IS_07980 [Candidatus Asgardarchaeia archaeon]
MVHEGVSKTKTEIIKWFFAILFSGIFGIMLFLGQEVSLLLLLIGGIGGILLALVTSEVAVVSVENLGRKTGISSYVSGVISSLASNLPEIAVAVIAASRGLTEFAVLVAVLTAGFNTLLLGTVIAIGNLKRGSIEVPEELVIIESPVMRGTIIMLALVVIYGMLSDIFAPGQIFGVPRDVSSLLVITYLLYLVFVLKYRRLSPEKAETINTLRNIIIPSIVGFGGIFIASELLSRVVETSVHIFGMSEAFLALLIALAGSIPEHSIAVLSSLKGSKKKIHLALGNLMAGVMQTYLLLIGLIGVIVVIPLTEFILFELVAGALLVWMIKSSITDDKALNLYEGAMIILTQSFAFLVFIDTMLGTL